MVDSDRTAEAISRLQELHRRAATAQIEHARAIAGAQRDLAATLRPGGIPEPALVARLTGEDQKELHAAATELGLPAGQSWTPEQLVALLRRIPDSLAALLVERWQADSAAAGRCWEMAHEGRLEQLNAQYNAAVLAHQCYEHTHPDEATLHAG